MRRIRYSVAMSLDGFIAGPNGEADWITMEPDFDFGALFSQFDTVLVGRKTFQVMAASGRGQMPGMKTVVLSRTLRQADYADVQIVAENPLETVAALRAEEGKDIWLLGGGVLFRSLAEEGLVDTVEVSIVPTILGAGIALAPLPTRRIGLTLTGQRIYNSGLVSLEYSVARS